VVILFTADIESFDIGWVSEDGEHNGKRDHNVRRKTMYETVLVIILGILTAILGAGSIVLVMYILRS